MSAGINAFKLLTGTVGGKIYAKHFKAVLKFEIVGRDIRDMEGWLEIYDNVRLSKDICNQDSLIESGVINHYLFE